MDEPLSNLDAALRISMRAEIKDLHRTMRTTFVYVTHDQAEALTLADRIVVMSDGLIQQVGAPDEIYERPANTFVASFLGSPTINYLDGAVRQADGELVFEGEGVRLTLPPAMARQLTERGRQQVRLGIRPEDVDERAEPREGESLHGRVDSVMPVGSDQFLGMKVAGGELFFRVGKDLRHEWGERIALSLDMSRLHAFDPETGESLLR